MHSWHLNFISIHTSHLLSIGVMQEDFKDCHQTLSAAGLVKVKWCKWHLFFGLNQKSKYGHCPPGLSKIIKVPTHGTGEPLWTAKSKMRVPEGAGLSTCWLCLAEHMREGGKNHYKTGRQCNRAGKLPWGGGRESREAEQLQDIKFSGKVGFNCCKKKTLCVDSALFRVPAWCWLSL